MKKLLSIVFVLLFTCSFSFAGSIFIPHFDFSTSGSSQKTNKQKYLVIGVKDGDTIVILFNGKEQTIRLKHIDCPEKGQAFGRKAKYFVSDLCFGDSITLSHINEFDKYKRMLAEIYLSDGRNLNKEIVKAGLGWHYKEYSKDPTYTHLEEQARKKKTGLWSDPHAQAPWEWRAAKRNKNKAKKKQKTEKKRK